jgi:RNA polymerase sigma factor (sigma-70 family)
LVSPGGNGHEGVGRFAERQAKAIGGRLEGVYGFRGADRPDIEQELKIAAWQARDQFDPARGSWEAFVSRVMRNHARNMIAARQAECRDFRSACGSLQDLIQPEPGKPPRERGEFLDADGYLRTSRRQGAWTDRNASSRDITRMVAELPADLQVMCAYLAQGMTVTAIAAELGISRDTFYERRKALQRAFDQAGLGTVERKSPTDRDRLR